MKHLIFCVGQTADNSGQVNARNVDYTYEKTLSQPACYFIYFFK